MNKLIEAYSDDMYSLNRLYDLLFYCLKKELYPFSDPEEHDILVDGLEAITSILFAWYGDKYGKSN